MPLFLVTLQHQAVVYVPPLTAAEEAQLPANKPAVDCKYLGDGFEKHRARSTILRRRVTEIIRADMGEITTTEPISRCDVSLPLTSDQGGFDHGSLPWPAPKRGIPDKTCAQILAEEEANPPPK